MTNKTLIEDFAAAMARLAAIDSLADGVQLKIEPTALPEELLRAWQELRQHVGACSRRALELSHAAIQLREQMPGDKPN